jgi:hypothetical protein
MNELKKVQLSKIDFHAATPIVFSEIINRTPYVYYGDNNQMPQYLIDAMNGCAIHKAILTSKVNQICGDGIVSLNNPMASINLINESETVSDVLRKIAFDLVLFGGYALNIIKTKDGKGIAEIYHLDFSRIRSGKINPETDKIDCYYYSPDWTNIKKYPPQEYPRFNMNDKSASQVYYYKCYMPNNSYYPIPDYSGALNAVSIDVELKNFHLNNLRKGMAPSLWIDYNNGVPEQEEQRQLVRALENQYGGTDNAGTAIISFNESKELAPTITQIARNESDNYYAQIYDDIQRSILSGHKVSSGELFGISSAGKLGTSSEIVDHSQYFRKTVIMPYQSEILPTLDKLVSIKFGTQTTFEIKPLSIYEVGDVIEQPIVEN